MTRDSFGVLTNLFSRARRASEGFSPMTPSILGVDGEVDGLSTQDEEMLAEAKMLREHKGRLEARMRMLEEQNRALDAQLRRLRTLLAQHEGSPVITPALGRPDHADYVVAGHPMLNGSTPRPGSALSGHIGESLVTVVDGSTATTSTKISWPSSTILKSPPIQPSVSSTSIRESIQLLRIQSMRQPIAQLLPPVTSKSYSSSPYARPLSTPGSSASIKMSSVN